MEDKPNKRHRGSNYTEGEKEQLLNIVAKYSHIIENKQTSNVFLKQKSATWTTIASEYNSLASTGLRSAGQLKILYENLKRKTRKQVADKNKARYSKELEEMGASKGDVIVALTQYKQDKKEMKKTGGGAYVPQLDDVGARVISIIQEQVQPISCEFDDAAVYFGDSKDKEDFVQQNKEAATRESPIISSPNPIIPTLPESKPVRTLRKNKITKTKYSADFLKKKYFSIKIENALLQKKNMIREHNLQMQVLRAQLAKLQKD